MSSNDRSQLDSTIVTVNVNDEKSYRLHKSLLTSHSKYFKAAFERDFQEAQEGAIRLTEVDIEIFDIFVDWLYSSDLDVADVKRNNFSKDSKLWDGDRDKENHQRVMQLIEVCIFADAHEVHELALDAIDELFDHCTNSRYLLPNRSHLFRAFSKLPASSPLLKLLVHVDCWYRKRPEDEDEDTEVAAIQETLPMECVARLCAYYRTVLWKLDENIRNVDHDLYLCDYHGHKNEQECKDCPRKRSEED